MPPRERKPTPLVGQDQPEERSEGQPAEQARSGEGDICGLCYPKGWPGENNAATCEHGTWQR